MRVIEAEEVALLLGLIVSVLTSKSKKRRGHYSVKVDDYLNLLKKILAVGWEGEN
jgi:hypothetical protein